MGQCLRVRPIVRELHVQQAKQYESTNDSDSDLDDIIVEELTDLDVASANINSALEPDAPLPVRSLSESLPTFSETILPGSHPDAVYTKTPDKVLDKEKASPTQKISIPIPQKEIENENPVDVRDDGYFSPLEKKQYEIDLFADAGKTPRLETPRVGETRDELAHRAMHAIDSIKMNHSSEIRWKKGKLIGSGAFGSVYVGRDEDRGELIAIKQAPIVTLGDEVTKRIRELQKEIRMMGRLAHPNIVQYLGTDRVTNFFCILMEYVPGGSLASIVKKRGCLSESVTRRYTKQILDGLHYLHCHRIVHRDIKGANILTTQDGVIKLADFGSSKKVADLVENGNGNVSLRGTPYWMAPEVIRQVCTGRQADIWGLGATIIEMGTGKPPWSENTSQVSALFQIAVATEPPKFPQGFSDDAKDFLSLCFARQPEDRPNALTLSRHKFIIAEVPATSISPASNSEPAAASAAVNSKHSHDESANTNLNLKLNIATENKELDSAKHHFTGRLHVSSSKGTKMSTAGGHSSDDLDSSLSSDGELSDSTYLCDDQHESMQLVPKTNKIGPRSRNARKAQASGKPKIKTSAALLSSSPAARSPIHQRVNGVRRTRPQSRFQLNDKRNNIVKNSKNSTDMDSDADVGDGVGAGDRKSSKSVASTSVSQPKPMIVKTDCPTGPHFGRNNRVSPVPPIDFAHTWNPVEPDHDQATVAVAGAKNDKRQVHTRQVRRQRHRAGRSRPGIKGGATRHRKPVVKDVFKFSAEDVSLADSKQQLDEPSSVTTSRGAAKDSSFTIETEDIDEEQPSPKPNFGSKMANPTGSKKCKSAFTEKISPEKISPGSIHTPHTAAAEDKAAGGERYQQPWVLRSLAPITSSQPSFKPNLGIGTNKVTPSLEPDLFQHPTSYKAHKKNESSRRTSQPEAGKSRPNKSLLEKARVMFKSPRVKKKTRAGHKKKVAKRKKTTKSEPKPTNEAQIAAAVASSGFKGEVLAYEIR